MASSIPAGHHVAALEAVGVDDLEAQVYREVLVEPGATQVWLADQVGAPASRIRSALRALEDKGLVTAAPTRPRQFTATAPQTALEALVQQQLGALSRVRVAAEALHEQYAHSTSHRTLQVVELLSGPAAVGKRFSQMQQTAEHEVMLLDRPPYFLATSLNQPVETSLLERGVPCRTIYGQRALDLPGRLDEIREDIRAGEQARYVPDLPLKLAIIDDQAVVPLLAHEDDERALVLEGSALVAGLKLLFELLWEQASPLDLLDRGTSGDTQAADAPDHDVLALLAAGLTDAVIARQLGVSARTIARRVSTILDDLGARSRFQAGVLATQRGWLDR